jgi:hypothetical protein
MRERIFIIWCQETKLYPRPIRNWIALVWDAQVKHLGSACFCLLQVRQSAQEKHHTAGINQAARRYL